MAAKGTEWIKPAGSTSRTTGAKTAIPRGGRMLKMDPSSAYYVLVIPAQIVEITGFVLERELHIVDPYCTAQFLSTMCRKPPSPT